MKLIKVFLLGLFGIILPVSLSAQTISGKLIDENSQPLPYANVVLLSLPDSAFVNGTISGEDGSFTLEATSENQIVEISSIGYKTVYKPTTPAYIGIVQLVSDVQMLGEVVVKGNIPVTRIKNDALETNVQGTVLSKAGTAEDVLAHAQFSRKPEQLKMYWRIYPVCKKRLMDLRCWVKVHHLFTSMVENCVILLNWTN